MNALGGLAVAVAVVAVSSLLGSVWRARSRRLRRVDSVARAAAGGAGPVAGGVTLMQFSSPTCARCDRVRAVCADVASGADGVRHVEIDVAVDLEQARAYGVWRVPTLLVIDGVGRVVRRAVGVPNRTDLEAAVAEAAAQEAAVQEAAVQEATA